MKLERKKCENGETIEIGKKKKLVERKNLNFCGKNDEGVMLKMRWSSLIAIRNVQLQEQKVPKNIKVFRTKQSLLHTM
jgi:hypothetical protein